MAQGIEQGMAQGIEQANRDNARKMKLKGIPDEMITDITGISIEDIHQLLKPL